MSDIPVDVRHAAMKAVNDMPILHDEMDTEQFWYFVETQVCRAILAERERCADVAKFRGQYDLSVAIRKCDHDHNKNTR